MRHALVRSLLSALVTTCFALSAITWGSMPGCVSAGVPAHAAHQHQHGTAGDHPAHPGDLPGAIQCFVHLCCIQLATPASAAFALNRISAPEASSGLVAASLFIPIRPSHILPFAHAPPHTSV